MSAEIITLPVIRSFRCTGDFIEQRDREFAAREEEKTIEPPRCHPLLVVNNFRAKPGSTFKKRNRRQYRL